MENQSPTYSLRFERRWSRYIGGRYLTFEPGVYRVPSEIPHDFAQMALTQNVAHKTMPILELKRRKRK